MGNTGSREEYDALVEQNQRQIRETIAKQFVKYRKSKRMTQQTVADLAGIKRPNISRFESGDYNPTVDMMVKIATCVGLELDIRLKEH
ncbi:MAG: helix-turn-helix transcriptional regulator [Lachnospiraceae bacterium]